MGTERIQQALASRLLGAHPRTSAVLLEEMSSDSAAEALSRQSPVSAARVLEHMQPERVAATLSHFEPAFLRAALPEVAAPQASSALSWLPDGERNTLFDSLGRGDARELRGLMDYPPGSAGSLMDPRFVVARDSDTVERAIVALAKAPATIHQMPVVDENMQLVGVVPVQAVAVADHDTPMASLANRDVRALDPFTPREEVVEFLARTGLPSIPVVDRERRLLGVLRHTVLVGAAEEEAAAAMQQMVGASKDENALSPPVFAARKRLPWLNINLLTAFLAAAVVGVFESTIAQVTSLAVLLPVVAGQSGNSGSQALAVTMRGLALREIRSAHWPRVLAKEAVVGTLNGVAIAVVCAAGVFVWSGSPMLALVIAVAMVVSMMAAGMAGASIPILLKRLGQDPAQSSSIILTTVTDVVGFSSFLGLATLLVNRL